MNARPAIEAALAKPLPHDKDSIGDPDCFNPWEDIIRGIDGFYASESDLLMINALKAVQNSTQGEFMDSYGFAGEFALYVLSGHYLTNYGTSPRFAWPDERISDLWSQIISKWKEWYEVSYGEKCPVP